MMAKDTIKVNMNIYDIPILVEALEEANKEIERLNKKIEQYENPEDMTLMFMWCDEKAKDEIKRLNNIINELEKWVVESIEKYTEDYLDWKYDRNVYLAGSKKLQNVLDKLQELKGSDKE